MSRFYGPYVTVYLLFKGDSLSGHRGHKFSTRDQDNDAWPNSCAERFKGAWWYSSCHASNLNGLYLRGNHSSYADGVNWRYWTGFYYSLRFTEMKIRPFHVQHEWQHKFCFWRVCHNYCSPWHTLLYMYSSMNRVAMHYYYYEDRTHSTHTGRKTDEQTDREWIQNNTPSIKSNIAYKYIK